MVAGTIAGNISAEAITRAGNTFAEAMRGPYLDLILNNPVFLSRITWIAAMSRMA